LSGYAFVREQPVRKIETMRPVAAAVEEIVAAFAFDQGGRISSRRTDSFGV